MTAIYAAWATLIGAAAIILITVHVMRSNAPERPTGPVMGALYRIRLRYFLVLVAALVIALIGTIPLAPYPARQVGKPDATVVVTGYMWYWDLAAGGEAPLEWTEDGALRVEPGALVEFQVKAADVNHGFGLYDPAGRLRAQTQAMPGYTNRLRHRFEEPGSYQILCMEYCGLAHHVMTGEIVVE